MSNETLQNYNLSNNFLFFRTMSEPDLCQLFLEKLLKIEIAQIEICQAEKKMDFSLMGKGVRFDIYIKDTEGTVYEIEMQAGKEVDLGLRSRYYQSMIDTDSLDKGHKYRELPKSYVIFVCTEDYFNKDRYLYTFRTICEEEPGLILKDHALKIVLNTKGTLNDIDEELIEFLKYIDKTTDEIASSAKGELVKQFHKRVKVLKQDKEVERDAMTLAEILEEKLLEGRLEGIQEGKLESAMKFKAKGLAADLIAEALDLPLEAVEKL